MNTLLSAALLLALLACSSEKDLARSDNTADSSNTATSTSGNGTKKDRTLTSADSQSVKTSTSTATSTQVTKPNPPPPPKDGEEAAIMGELSGVSVIGRIYGFAYQKDRPDEVVNVAIYIDTDTGQPAMTIPANQAGFDNGAPGDHTYATDMPMSFRDGKAHKAYVVLESMTGQRAITPTGFGFTSYAPKAAGKAYYTATLQPLLQTRCAACHQITYETHWANLITPAPSEGGTATNNQLLQKPAALVSHGGGKICASATSSPCAQIQEFWKREFGP